MSSHAAQLDNILVGDNPDRPVVRLCDFGTSFSAPAEEGGGEEGSAAPFLPYLGPEFICNDRVRAWVDPLLPLCDVLILMRC